MMWHELYNSNKNRSNNQQSMHLFILQFILRAFKLDHVNGLLLFFFLTFAKFIISKLPYFL